MSRNRFGLHLSGIASPTVLSQRFTRPSGRPLARQRSQQRRSVACSPPAAELRRLWATVAGPIGQPAPRSRYRGAGGRGLSPPRPAYLTGRSASLSVHHSRLWRAPRAQTPAPIFIHLMHRHERPAESGPRLGMMDEHYNSYMGYQGLSHCYAAW